MKYLLLLTLLPLFSLHAQTEGAPSAEEILIQRPEKHLRHESMIYDLNTDLGIRDQRKYTGEDNNRLSVAGHISGDYEHFDEIFGFEANYMRKTSWFNELW